MKVLDYHGLTKVWNKIKNLVSGKADKVSNATLNNLASLDANGNLKDSGGSWKNTPVPSTYVGTAGYVEFGRIVCETQMNHPVVFEVFARARSVVRLEVMLVLNNIHKKPGIDWTRLTYYKDTQNIEVGYTYVDSSAESDGIRTYHFWIKVKNYGRVGTRVSTRHDYISGGVVSAQNTYSETAPTGYTIIQANDSLDDKVSKSGDTMTGRLTMEKAINQVLIGTGTAATSSTSGSTTTYYPALWKYNLSEANPTPGDRLVIKTPVAGSDWGTYLSTDNGTTYYPVARNTGASRLTNQYPAGAYICVVFEEYVSGSSAAGQVNDVFPVAGSTARVSQKIGCWRVINDYDSGNTVSAIRTENGRFRTGSTGCNPYALVCLDKNGTFSMLTSSGSGTGTSKTINTSGKFKLDAVILWYNANNTTAANTIVSSTYVTYNIHHAVDTRYSHNHTTTFTTNAPLYIECTIDEDGFWSPTTTCITQTLTSGKYYIFLGMTYSTEYQLSLMADHPLYYYDGTNLTQVPRLSKADRTKLDGIASGATKVESSSTNGSIKINDTDTTVYTHPTQTAYSAKGSATKVPKITTDSTGHVTSIEEVTISGVTPASHSHGNIANGGTLTDTAAAAAGNDYVVIRDADNAKIQTSTIKGTDVADAVSKKHSHSTLTLSTTAQAYDGTHTLALPSSDPYSSARTPASHSHGNIRNNGTIIGGDDNNGKPIANGDRLVVAETTNDSGYKAVLTTTSFDGSTTTKALTPKGTFESFAKAGDITTAIQALDVSSVGGSGKYISAISETDGKISATATTMDTAPTASSTNAVTSGGVKTALDGKQNDVKYQLVEYGAVTYSDVAAIITAGKVPVVYRENSLYVCDGTVYSVNNVNEYRFTYASGNVDSPRIVFLKLRDSSAGWGGGVISLATPSSVTSVADSRFPYYTVDNPNWDDLTSIGEYKVTNSDSTGTAKNSPERGAINARVYNINDGSTPFITQIAVGDDMYYRSKYGDRPWSPWRYFPQSNTVRRIEQGSLGSATDTLYIV